MKAEPQPRSVIRPAGPSGRGGAGRHGGSAGRRVQGSESEPDRQRGLQRDEWFLVCTRPGSRLHSDYFNMIKSGDWLELSNPSAASSHQGLYNLQRGGARTVVRVGLGEAAPLG